MRTETAPTSRPLILHAPNVHQGGGRTLLAALLSGLPADARGVCFLDSRLDLSPELPRGIESLRIRPTLRDRWRAERLAANATTDNSQLLCFHSLPPLFRCRGEVTVFVQNRHLIDTTDISEFPLRQRLRIRTERLWFRHAMRHANSFVVQTETMRQLVRTRVGIEPAIRVLPLAPSDLAASTNSEPAITLPFNRALPAPPRTEDAGPSARYDFCYVATGEPHKNHRVLVEAWIQLAERGFYPSLCLTLPTDRFADLSQWIDSRSQQHHLRIVNAGYMGPDGISEIYTRSKALVYPSLYESFGLPLLEARQQGLEIVAAELDYVRDVVSPDQTFDPGSPRSLARAIERSMGIECELLPPIDGSEFIRRLFAA